MGTRCANEFAPKGSDACLVSKRKGAVSDRIQGLKVGGDDYLPKPFRLEELLLRVQAILRRQPTLHAQSGTPPIRFGRNQFDPTTFRATSSTMRHIRLPNAKP